MPACLHFRKLRTRFQDLTGFRRKEKKRVLEISAPFNFKKEEICLPGITEDEISVLREKAAASCIGIAHDRDPTAFGSLQEPPRIPTRSSSLMMRPHESSMSTTSVATLW